jgi:hypothetical protein
MLRQSLASWDHNINLKVFWCYDSIVTSKWSRGQKVKFKVSQCYDRWFLVTSRRRKSQPPMLRWKVVIKSGRADVQGCDVMISLVSYGHKRNQMAPNAMIALFSMWSGKKMKRIMISRYGLCHRVKNRIPKCYDQAMWFLSWDCKEKKASTGGRVDRYVGAPDCSRKIHLLGRDTSSKWGQNFQRQVYKCKGVASDLTICGLS